MKRLINYVSVSLATAILLSTSSFAFDGIKQISAIDSKVEIGIPLSHGINVIAYSTPLNVSGIIGESISFSPEIFNKVLGFVPTAITILSLPNVNSGTLMCDQKNVNVGDYISVLNLSDFIYEPITEDDAEFCFSPDGVRVMTCKIHQKNSKNTDPEITESAISSAKTRLDTSVTGCFLGSDVDGDEITYEITSFPSMGLVEITDASRGIYVYHPYEGVSGTDSFKYRAKDSFGGYSEEQTVTVNVEKKKSVVYTDTITSNNISAINEMVESGIMAVKTTSQGNYFEPDSPVSRIDFLVMAMKAMGADQVAQVMSTPFSDDTSLSPSEKGYLNLAYKLGIIKGTKSDGVISFDPYRNITGNEAALIVNAVLGLPSDDSVSVSTIYDSVPVWAAPSVWALTKAGIVNADNFSPYLELTRENTAVILSGIRSRMS